MQQGIGRAGFTLLALVTFAIGAFGFALTWTAFGLGQTTFFQMGLGVAAVALLALFLFAVFAPSKSASAAPAPAATPAPEPTTKPVPAPTTPGMDYEFTDFQPAAKAAPESLELPKAFQEAPPTPQPDAAPVAFKPVSKTLDATIEQVVEEAPMPTPAPAAPARDPAAWPGARGKSAWTNKVDHQRKVQEQVESARRRQDLAEKYTRTTPTLRAILDDKPARQSPQAETVPEKLADRAPGDMNTDFVAPGMSVGQCGQCRTLLLAPEERPLRLKCPECAKVTLLQ